MAKYNVTCECGHEITVDLFGKSDERQRRIAYLSSNLCPECLAAKRKEEIELKKDGINLPSLNGSEKQIIWAESIRLQMLNVLTDIYNRVPENGKEKAAKAIEAYKEDIFKKTSASWWIDNRDEFGIRTVASELNKYL